MIWLPAACVALVVQAGVGNIEGTVRDTTGKPLSAALVRIEGSPVSTVTDSAGRYRIAGVAPGTVMLAARSFTYSPYMSDGLVVRAGETTHVDVVLRSKMAARRAVRLRCEPGHIGPAGGVCLELRPIGPLARNTPPGIGIIRDPQVWEALVRQFGTHSLESDTNRIDWQREMVLIESYGNGMMELEPRPRLNRVEQRNDTLIALFGPDSLIGERMVFADGWITPRAYAMPRSELPIRYERRVGEIWIPRTVDWGAIVSNR